MLELRQIFCVCALVIVCRLEFGESYVSSNDEWNAYKLRFPKNYAELGMTEATARYNYNYNMYYITLHNNNKRSSRLAANQFTDMRWTNLIPFFQATTPRTEPTDSPLPPPSNNIPPVNFDPRELGLIATVQDQGYRCNSGWAYATAKAIEYKQAFETGNLGPNVLSAQNLIDCAGLELACTRQVPQQAFDYLVTHKQPLRLEEFYMNNNNLPKQGMCIPQSNRVIYLDQYARIQDGDDARMKNLVATNYPVIVEFDPTSFEFLHYASGVFTPANTARRGSHFMTVIGYGIDSVSGQDYWLVQNSFGSTWGENGFIRIATKWGTQGSLTKSAILPL